jgi:hypothetical protein
MATTTKKGQQVSKVLTFDLTPDPTITKQSQAILVSATNLQVTTAIECKAASELLARVQRFRRFVSGVYKRARAPLTKAARENAAEEKRTLAPFITLEATIESLIKTYRQQEADTRAAAEAEERRQREDLARAEQEARAAELRQAAEAATSKKVRGALLKQADIVEHATPIIDPVEVAEPEDTLADDMHERVTYHAAVQNLEALSLQIAAQLMVTKYGAPPAVRQYLDQFKPHQQATMSLLQPAMPRLNDLARALKQDLALQGVTAEKDTGFVTRG